MNLSHAAKNEVISSLRGLSNRPATAVVIITYVYGVFGNLADLKPQRYWLFLHAFLLCSCAAGRVWGWGQVEEGGAGGGNGRTWTLSLREKHNERMRQHRARVKQNPHLYQLYKQRQRLYDRKYRDKRKGSQH